MKFVWRIENFSKLGGKLVSPSFSSHSTTWELILPEENFKNGTFLKIELHNCRYVENFPKKCSFALLDLKGLPIVWQEEQIKKIQGIDSRYRITSENVSLGKKKDLLNSREFLQTDILIVECHICNTVNDFQSPLSIFARSRIESNIFKSFELNIHKASFFREDYILPHVEPIVNGEFLTIKSKTVGYGFEFKSKVSMFRCIMEIQIMLLGELTISNQKLSFTSADETLTFATEMPMSMSIAHQNRFFYNDTITLKFICSITESVTINRIVEENEIWDVPRPIVASNEILNVPRPIIVSNELSNVKSETKLPTDAHSPNTISRALQGLLKEGLFSDFNLKVNDRLFPVHKNILSARSQVFRAMFTAEMKEKEDNFVVIPDVAEDTLQQLLLFVYSDEFNEGIDWEKASCLYSAADKYALEPLKQRCSVVLKSGLSVSSVLQVLVLADMHQDRDLKSAAFDFISLNHRDIVDTEIWSKFEEENAKLALDTFRSLYVKKMKG